MSNKTLSLTDSLYEYLLAVSLREPAILTELRRETAQLSTHNMQISPEQGQFMALLIELMGARKTLEIGVYTGYSSLAVALALPSDGKLVACDVSKEWTAIAQRYWEKAGVARKIDLHIAPAITTLDKLIAAGERETFDFTFIDADKASYDAYYEKALLLIRKGGLIMFDNTLQRGDVIDASIQSNTVQAIRQLNEKLHQDERITLSMLPISDGISLARKR